MRCIDGENELILTCETQAEGVCILRCETRDPVVLLPDEIEEGTRLRWEAFVYSILD